MFCASESESSHHHGSGYASESSDSDSSHSNLPGGQITITCANGMQATCNSGTLGCTDGTHSTAICGHYTPNSSDSDSSDSEASLPGG